VRSLSARWLEFWFAPAPPTTLAVCRILFFGAILAQYSRFDVRGVGDLPEALWEPTWLFAALDLPLATDPALRWLQIAWKTALLLSCVGLATRVSTVVSFGLGFYLLGLLHNFGKVNHDDAIIILVLGVMALSRAGDAMSLDATIARLSSRSPVVVSSGEYTWPLRCVCLALALIYLAAGVGKLSSGGFEWVTSDHLALLLLRNQYEYQPPTAWGPWLARWPALCHALAAATILIELSYPLALASRRARLLVVPSAIAMQLAIGLLIGPRFYTLIACNLFWVPWASALAWVGLRPGSTRTSEPVSPRRPTAFG
jgi:hypothetical protein